MLPNRFLNPIFLKLENDSVKLSHSLNFCSLAHSRLHHSVCPDPPPLPPDPPRLNHPTWTTPPEPPHLNHHSNSHLNPPLNHPLPDLSHTLPSPTHIWTKPPSSTWINPPPTWTNSPPLLPPLEPNNPRNWTTSPETCCLLNLEVPPPPNLNQPPPPSTPKSTHPLPRPRLVWGLTVGCWFGSGGGGWLRWGGWVWFWWEGGSLKSKSNSNKKIAKCAEKNWKWTNNDHF